MEAFWDGFEKRAAMNYYRLPTGHPAYHMASQGGKNPGVIASTAPVAQWEKHKIDQSSLVKE